MSGLSGLSGMSGQPAIFGVKPVPLLLDNIPASFAVSTRKLRTDYAGQCLRIRRASDNIEQDFGFTGNPPVLDTAGIATFIGASTGSIVTWYDESGNTEDVTQAVGNKQPGYVASGQNSLDVLDFIRTSLMVLRNGTFSASQSLTAFAVYKSDLSTVPNAIGIYDSNNAGNRVFFGILSGTNRLIYGASAVQSGSLVDTAWHTSKFRANGASSVATRDGADEGIGNPGVQGMTGISIGDTNGAGGFAFDGKAGEFVIFDTITPAEEATIEADIQAAWATP